MLGDRQHWQVHSEGPAAHAGPRAGRLLARRRVQDLYGQLRQAGWQVRLQKKS